MILLFSKNFDNIHVILNIDNNQKCSAKQHIRMISEGSCKAKDVSNDAENAALHQEYFIK